MGQYFEDVVGQDQPLMRSCGGKKELVMAEWMKRRQVSGARALLVDNDINNLLTAVETRICCTAWVVNQVGGMTKALMRGIHRAGGVGLCPILDETNNNYRDY